MRLKTIAIFSAGMLCEFLISRKLTHPPPAPICPEPAPPLAKREPARKPAPVLAGSGVALPRARPPVAAEALARSDDRPPKIERTEDDTCPSTGAEFRASHPEEDHLTCLCTPAAVAAYGNVWGTGIYTADSSICKAARHDGALGNSARAVTVYFRAGLNRYEGSESNGVRSADYGRWESSIAFSP